MSRINYRIFLVGFLFFVFFFSFSQSSQAGFFDWFKWFRKNNLQNTNEVIPSVKKASSSSQKSSSSSVRKASSSKSSSASSKASNPKSSASSKRSSSFSKSSSSVTSKSSLGSSKSSNFSSISQNSSYKISLKSEFFKGDSTAQKIASGESAGVDITTFPLKAVRSYVSTDSFAYRVVSALRMLGYQEGLNSEAYVGQEFLGDFKRLNNLPVTTMIDGTTLQKIDSQLVDRESEDLKLAKNFPLYSYFITAPKNEPTKEHVAALFDIAFSALPSNLVMWSEANFKAYLRDQGGKQFSGSGANYEVCLSVLYPEVDDNCSMNTKGIVTFWGPDLNIVGTQIHEYAHFLDGSIYSKEQGTSRGIIDTNNFYTISYDTSNTSYPAGSTGKPYPIRRPSSAKDEFVSGYSMGWALSGKDTDKYIRTPQEDFAESFAMYVVTGKVFRELAKSSSVLSQKYDWLKQNVFGGKEYNTGEIRGIAFMKANPTSMDVTNGAYNILHFSTYLSDFAWDYRF